MMATKKSTEGARACVRVYVCLWGGRERGWKVERRGEGLRGVGEGGRERGEREGGGGGGRGRGKWGVMMNVNKSITRHPNKTTKPQTSKQDIQTRL